MTLWSIFSRYSHFCVLFQSALIVRSNMSEGFLLCLSPMIRNRQTWMWVSLSYRVAGMVIWKVRGLTRGLSVIHELRFGHCNHRVCNSMGNLYVSRGIQSLMCPESVDSSAVGGKYVLTSSVLTNSVSAKDQLTGWIRCMLPHPFAQSCRKPLVPAFRCLRDSQGISEFHL